MSHPLVMALFRDVGAAAAAARGCTRAGCRARRPIGCGARPQGRRATSPGKSMAVLVPRSRIRRLPRASGSSAGTFWQPSRSDSLEPARSLRRGHWRPSLARLPDMRRADLKSTLIKAGLPDADADRWRAQIESGQAILLGVHARTANGSEVEAALGTIQHRAGRPHRSGTD